MVLPKCFYGVTSSSHKTDNVKELDNKGQLNGFKLNGFSLNCFSLNQFFY